ncbi:hypothetical protein [Bradyrhizobium guangdongense]
MLRISSVRAVIISNIVQFVLSMVIVTASAFVIVALRVPAPLPARGVIPLGGIAMLMSCLSIVPSSLIAGFVAGRIAEYRPVVHGALSTSIFLIQELYALFHSAFIGVPPRMLGSILLGIVSIFAALLFGALGGYGAARTSGGAGRDHVAPVPRTRFVEGGLIAKLLLSLVVTAGVCAFILFSPMIFCHGGGAGGNCGEAYMLSIPAALLALPIVFAGTLFLA